MACYNGPSGDTPGEDSGTTACLVLLFKVLVFAVAKYFCGLILEVALVIF